MKQYFDKHNVEIKEGMKLRGSDGKIEWVYKSDNGNLGVCADNPNYPHTKATMSVYPLSEFSADEFEIVEE